MSRFCFVFLAILFSSALTVFGQNQNTPERDTTLISFPFNSPRSNGMGGNHAALADDFETLFVNPAGITTAEDQFSVAAFDLTVHDIDTTLRLISTNFSDPAVYAARIKNYYESGFNSNGPLMIGSIRNDAGWGLLNRQYLKIWWERDNIFVVHANMVEEAAFYFGRSFPIRNFEETVTFTPGFTVKPNFRVIFAPRNIPAVDFRHILRNLQEQPFEFQAGLGVNVGFLLSFSDMVYFSAVSNDLLSPLYVTHYASYADYAEGISPTTTGIAFLRPSYDFSACFRTKNVFPGDIVRDIVFTVDYHLTSDTLENANRNLLLDIGAGIELQILRALWIRVGWQQMLPGGGFGIDFGWMKVDVAVFGETFGDQLSDYQGVSLSVGFSSRF
ncbi:MAG: hypothetical protein LBG27_08175 [Spirochaetaceae bacterium]|jgi:hypothetical protein|nr:hypothetical protein [Spirochaetaceae bacterium]